MYNDFLAQREKHPFLRLAQSNYLCTHGWQNKSRYIPGAGGGYYSKERSAEW